MKFQMIILLIEMKKSMLDAYMLITKKQNIHIGRRFI